MCATIPKYKPMQMFRCIYLEILITVVVYIVPKLYCSINLSPFVEVKLNQNSISSGPFRVNKINLIFDKIIDETKN